MRTIHDRGMDIKAEKLYLIEQLARLEDIEIIHQIKDILSSQKEPIAGYKPGGGPITRSELVARARDSNKAIKEGRVISIEELEKESENW
ncbi:hypothetical protein [Cyclobacterium jeungdonense]|uniref:Addiction module component n=1 Tax=Cyclobacterium jeungdonense TaxID=708087 RepID=A0ABT8C7Z9_9BACT|nr:hypothetical protein [Cyclobacterium jeungdonense]MDN3688914.1 hypothetical protein [Cyclobacterium jeungdonense]